MIELKKLSKQYKRFGIKLFLSYILFTILLIISITIIHLYFSQELRENKFEREVTMQSSEKKDKFYSYINVKKDALQAIIKNEYFLEYIKSGSYNYYIDLLFITIMEANKDYMQMRYIDENGHEILRYDRKTEKTEPYKVFTLQDKSQRYYFKESLKNKSNEILMSKLDLNMEYGEVEIPYKPVLRLSIPIYIENKFKGIFIINIFMNELIKNLTKSTLYDIFLVDQNGFYIKHKNSQYDWSYYNSKRKISDDFDKFLVSRIYTSKEDGFIDHNIFIQPLFIHSQKLYLMMKENKQSISDMESNNNKMVTAILIFATIMAFIFTMLFTRLLRRIFEFVVEQADKLHDLATNLDNEINLKTLEIAKKDRLLQNQSKLAELGEMIGNIAHQWRHPLTRLSLTLQNLKAYKKRDKLSDELFYESLGNSLYQIEFMSNTIDNFKNFYKKDETKTKFILKESIENMLNIIGTVIEHSHIKLSIECAEEISMFANKNEFSQVLMNLMINAKEAIDEKRVKNPMIGIKVTKSFNVVTINIFDNAGGVPSCLLDKIFDPYFTTKSEKGTGIGLYMSKIIIEEKMNGSLTVHNSENGAIFTIIIKDTSKGNELE
jgi:signal transduction histidine kinase